MRISDWSSDVCSSDLFDRVIDDDRLADLARQIEHVRSRPPNRPPREFPFERPLPSYLQFLPIVNKRTGILASAVTPALSAGAAASRGRRPGSWTSISSRCST